MDTDKSKAILAERARFIAKEIEEMTISSSTNLLVFALGEQKYAMAYHVIDKVIPEQTITAVPGNMPFFSGLIYYNAEMWPVVDLSQLLGCKQPALTQNLILLHDGKIRFALAVGTIIGQITYDESLGLISLPSKHRYITGIYDNDVALIDLAAIFNVLKN